MMGYQIIKSNQRDEPPQSDSGATLHVRNIIENIVHPFFLDAAKEPIRTVDNRGAFPPALWPILRDLVPPVVVDANVLRNDIGYACKHEQRTSLVTSANVGCIRTFCAPHVIAEVDEHSRRWADEKQLDYGRFISCWREEYLPLLRCVDPPSNLLTKAEDLRIQELRIKDSDDVPSATLALLLGGFYLSQDHDPLEAVYGRGVDLKLHEKWLPLLQSGSNASHTLELSHIAILPPALLGQGLYDIGKSLYSKNPWIPVGLIAGSLGLIFLGWRSDPDRAKGFLARLGDTVLQITQVVTEIGAYIEERQSFFAQAFPVVSSWEDWGYEFSAEQLVARQCMYSLAREPKGHLSAVEMYDALPFIVKGQEKTIRAVLRKYSCFSEARRGRWQLGCCTAGEAKSTAL